MQSISQTEHAEIEKEMEKYPVVTFADILRALKQHPDWLEELRKLILTSELLELPRKVDELLRRVTKLEERVGKIEEDLAVLKQDVAVLKQDVSYMKGELGRLKGKDFERTIREKYYSYFGRLLRKSKLMPFEKIVSMIDDFEDEGLITAEERESLLRLDLVVSGQIRESRKPVVLAVEVSYGLYEEDIRRAAERAAVLARMLPEEVIPVVVASEVKEEIEKVADEAGVLVIKAEY